MFVKILHPARDQYHGVGRLQQRRVVGHRAVVVAVQRDARLNVAGKIAADDVRIGARGNVVDNLLQRELAVVVDTRLDVAAEGDVRFRADVSSGDRHIDDPRLESQRSGFAGIGRVAVVVQIIAHVDRGADRQSRWRRRHRERRGRESTRRPRSY